MESRRHIVLYRIYQTIITCVGTVRKQTYTYSNTNWYTTKLCMKHHFVISDNL